MKSIDFVNVHKSYGHVEVINGLNLNIPSGIRLVLLGPSGCGKTTILRMISGLESITAGDLFMGGKKVNDVEPGDRNVSMVFQNYALYPHMTIEDNILFGMQVAKVDKKDQQERLYWALNILELTPYIKRYPKELSGGQRQRVALCRALVKKAPYLLLDEPLSNLDAQLRTNARAELIKIHEVYSPTFVYVTHDQVEAMTLAQRMMVMNAGVMEQFGTPEEVYNRPASTFVASFMGSPPMNLLKSAPGVKAGQILGVRPEHLDITSSGHGWTLQVEAIELLGAERLLYCLHGDERVIIRVDENQATPTIGSTVSATPRADKVHHFDAASGKRVS